MTPEQLDAIYKWVVIVAGSGGIGFAFLKVIELIVNMRVAHSKSLDNIAETRTTGDVEAQRQTAALAKTLADEKAESDRRQAELLTSMIGIVTSLIPRLDKLTSAQEAFTAETRIEHALEQERLKMRETELVLQRATLQSNTDAIATFAPALSIGVEVLSKEIRESVTAIGTKVQLMGDDISEKFEARLTETKAGIDKMTASFDALIALIKEALVPVPERIENIHAVTTLTSEEVGKMHQELSEISKQLTDLQNTLATNRTNNLPPDVPPGVPAS